MYFIYSHSCFILRHLLFANNMPYRPNISSLFMCFKEEEEEKNNNNRRRNVPTEKWKKQML